MCLVFIRTAHFYSLNLKANHTYVTSILYFWKSHQSCRNAINSGKFASFSTALTPPPPQKPYSVHAEHGI